jgi:MauM/NapG family ferredoxin protein
LAAHPYREGFPADFLLRLDPLIAVTTSVGMRDLPPSLAPGLVVLIVTLLIGRFFCGHICPMGTSLDILETVAFHRKNPGRNDNSAEKAGQFKAWKYLFLAAIAAAAVGGVSIAFLGSPLSLTTRFYGLVLYPLCLLAGDSALQLVISLPGGSAISAADLWNLPTKVFATNFFVATLFLGIAALALVQPRFWCRNLCPAGALLAIFGRSPWLKRHVDESCIDCGRCIRECPTAAISEAPEKTVHAECIVCLHCAKVCPVSAISFTRRIPSNSLPLVAEPDPTRRSLVLAMGTGLLAAGLLRTSLDQPLALATERPLMDPELIRPPGALPEGEFRARCVRCGECMKACPTNTLQPVWLKSGLEGLFTPAMTPRLGGCAVNCSTCGKVCPTGAIRDLPLIEKNHAKVGTAWIVRQNCLVWEQDKKCLVCDEVCPYNALSFQPVEGLRNAAPFVKENRCTGCGWCEMKCPVEGASAIRVNVIGAIRLSTGSYVEKAREYGLVFKARDSSADQLAPGTFEGQGQPAAEDDASSPGGSKSETETPPGFILK